MARTWLQRLALWSARHYRQVFLGFALVLAVSAFFITRIKFDTDVLHLLPKKDPALNAYMDTLADYGTFDYLLIVVGVPEGTAADPYEAYVDALAPRLAQVPELERVDYRIDDPEKLISELFPRAVLFLEAGERERLAAKLSPTGVAQRAAELRRLLSTPQSLMMRDLLRLDPFGVAEIFFERIGRTQNGMAIDWTSGYYLSQDQRLLLLLGKPKKAPQDIAFDRAMVANVERAIAATNAEWTDLAGPEPPPAPVVKVGGSHVSAMVDEGLIRGDMTLNIGSSMLFVFVLFLFAFRRIGTLTYAFLPLAFGLVLTFGFAGAAIGVVSSATSGTAALLIGLGIDFVIVSYGRFVDERRRGLGFEEALAVTMGSSGRAVVIGAVTTAATFYAFTFTDFTGLRQMGILTGSGILFCLATVLVLLPAMLAFSEAHHARRDRTPTLYLHSFATDRVLGFCARHPRAVLAVGMLFTVITGVLAFGLRFEDSWRSMRPKGNPGVEVEELVAEHFKSEFDYMMLLLSGSDLDEVFERTEAVSQRAQALVAEGSVSSITSVTSLIPPPNRQREALAWLAAGRQDGSLDAGRIRGDFAAALASEGMRLEPFAAGLGLLDEALAANEPISPEQLSVDGQAAQLLARYLHKTPHGWRSVVQLNLPAERWRREPPPAAMALADELGPDVLLTGANVVSKIMRERVRRDAWIAAVLGTFLVFLLLWLDFGRVRAAVFALIPLFIGITWMLGAMVALGLPMNFMNIFVTTMIIGVGVDYGIHMVHRYREVLVERKPFLAGLAETGNAVVVAALSTLAGFGSISLSHYPGLRSTGYVAILGVVATCVVSITLLPAFLALRHPNLVREEAAAADGQATSPPTA